MTEEKRTLPRAMQPLSRETLLERRRMRRVTGMRPYAAVLFILLSLLLVGKELERYWMHDKPISGAVIAISAVIGFLGAYMLSHNDTKDAASFIVDKGVTIIGAIRGGRRATDPVVVVPPPTDEQPPQDHGGTP